MLRPALTKGQLPPLRFALFNICGIYIACIHRHLTYHMSVRVYIFYFITIVTDGYISEWYTWTSHPALGRPIPTYIPSPYGLEFLSSVNNKEQEPRALVPDKASLAWQGQGVVLVLSWLIGAGQVLSLLACWHDRRHVFWCHAPSSYFFSLANIVLCDRE